ncbi:MAG: TonB-dependent receptor domain-containing protein, partial [Sporomusa sp.]
ITLSRKLSPQWDVSAGYSYVKKENKAGDAGYENDDGNSEPRGYHLGVQYHQDKWNARMDVKGVTGRSTQYFTSESYWVVDLAASYRVSPDTRAYVKVYNLTDRAYESLGSLNWNTMGHYPMPARQWVFGLEHRM